MLPLFLQTLGLVVCESNLILPNFTDPKRKVRITTDTSNLSWGPLFPQDKPWALGAPTLRISPTRAFPSESMFQSENVHPF